MEDWTLTRSTRLKLSLVMICYGYTSRYYVIIVYGRLDLKEINTIEIILSYGVTVPIAEGQSFVINVIGLRINMNIIT